MKRVLLIEDDKYLSNGVLAALRNPELTIIPQENLTKARVSLTEQHFDLVLLDVNLPDGSGLDLLQEIKQSGDTPVILMTANDTEMDVVLGLEQGADDYVTKPFSLAILRARVANQLRRSSTLSSDTITIEDYAFDFGKMSFTKSGIPVELSKTEQKLLRLLVENRGCTLSRETLMGRIWPDGTDYVDENTLSVTIKRLRDKLEAAKHIKTVYGIGYSWVVGK